MIEDGVEMCEFCRDALSECACWDEDDYSREHDEW